MPDLRLKQHLSHDGVAVLRLAGHLDMRSTAACREELLACCEAASAVIVDGAQVQSCDPAALELLVSGRQAVTASGGRFVLATPSFALAKTLRVTGLADAFLITCTVRAAHAAIAGIGSSRQSRVMQGEP